MACCPLVGYDLHGQRLLACCWRGSSAIYSRKCRVNSNFLAILKSLSCQLSGPVSNRSSTSTTAQGQAGRSHGTNCWHAKTYRGSNASLRQVPFFPACRLITKRTIRPHDNIQGLCVCVLTFAHMLIREKLLTG